MPSPTFAHSSSLRPRMLALETIASPCWVVNVPVAPCSRKGTRLRRGLRRLLCRGDRDQCCCTDDRHYGESDHSHRPSPRITTQRAWHGGARDTLGSPRRRAKPRRGSQARGYGRRTQPFLQLRPTPPARHVSDGDGDGFPLQGRTPAGPQSEFRRPTSVYPQAILDAIAAPSASVRSFAHMMLRWTRPASGLCEKPQSVPAIRLSRPTHSAKRMSRSATSSGCSTKSATSPEPASP
jgi:hypothetical protein